MDTPLEIEYKYLIRFPDIDLLKRQPDYKCEKITQLYLDLPKGLSEYGTNCRIRTLTDENGTRYIRTFKKSITDMTRIEIEDEISKEEYEFLSQYTRKGYTPIEKNRHSFSLYDFIYEVDVFPFWDDRAYLEIEVNSENTQPPIPDFIRIIKDVTTDKRYRNAALAQKIITEEI